MKIEPKLAKNKSKPEKYDVDLACLMIVTKFAWK